MDLISRAWLKEAIHNFFNGLNHKVTEEDIQAYVKATPSAFEGKTNWEALKTVFPYAEIVGSDETLTAVRIDSNPKTGTPIAMYTEWLNAPYSTMPKVRDK